MDFTRQQGLVSPERLAALQIDVVGCGGIGSATVPLLTKMGCAQVRVFDFDTVEDVNLPSQWFRLSDSARQATKVEACRDICRELSGTEIDAVATAADAASLRGIVVLAVDHMEARRTIWEGIHPPQVDWLIDARMGAQTCTLLTARPVDLAHRRLYESTLYADVLDLPCTARAIIYTSFTIAALVGRTVGRLAMGLPAERRIDLDIRNLQLLVA